MKRTFFFNIHEQFLTPTGLLDVKKSEESMKFANSIYWADGDTLAEGATNLAKFLSEVTDEMTQEEADALGDKYCVAEIQHQIK